MLPEKGVPLSVAMSGRNVLRFVRVYVLGKYLVKCLRKLSGKWGDVRTDGISWSLQEYKSIRIAVMVCTTLVNTQTHRQTAFDRLHGS